MFLLWAKKNFHRNVCIVKRNLLISIYFLKVIVFYGIAQWIAARIVYPVVHPHTPLNLMDLKCAFPAQPVMKVMVLPFI